ncbi:MAG: glycoside hydrolase family 3 C-terminal domain-containing protein [Clostridia bacterium]|nr:glycoside hydrolase family 3 C-terminal domain-containing protein [Clostridia bacterium]
MKIRTFRILCIVFCSLIMAAIIALDVICGVFSNTIIHYLSSTTTLADDVREDGEELAVQIEEEGITLVKNDGVLPLSKDADSKVSVLGWSSTQWISGGSGTGQTVQYGSIISADSSAETDFLDALTAYGISHYSSVTTQYARYMGTRPFYAAGSLNCEDYEYYRLYEPEFDTFYTPSLQAGLKAYSDTAVIVLGRVSGEGADPPKVQYKGSIDYGDPAYAADEERTYLDISTEEEDLLTWAGEAFEKTVVIINSAAQMNLGFLDCIDGLDACIVAGTTGNNAATAIPEVLYGDVNPSGRLTDTYAYDFTTSPSYINSGKDGLSYYLDTTAEEPQDSGDDTDTDTPETYRRGVEEDTDEGETDEPSEPAEPEVKHTDNSYLEYAEGIYTGYKWYETADAEGFWDTEYAKDRWGLENGYEDVVQYPFGYGLSYTTFSWTDEVLNVSLQSGAASSFSVTVTVANTGSVAGKDVIELYCTPPYTQGGAEKASETLVAYAKTDLLEPGEKEEITLSFSLEDTASYDETLNGGLGGYVLEAGDYLLSLKTDAHTTVADLVPYSLGADYVVGDSSNKFSGDETSAGIADGLTLLSRADFAATFPAEKSVREADESTATLGTYTEEQILDAFCIAPDEPEQEEGDDTDAAAPEENEDGSAILPLSLAMARSAHADGDDADNRSGSTALTLYTDLAVNGLGLYLGNPANYDDTLWDTVISQLTASEMASLVLHGYGHEYALDSIGKPERVFAYGASQIGSFHAADAGVGYPSQVVLAQTWNKQLCGEYGVQMGKEAADMGYDGWYAPGAVVHRTPFAGGNFENSAEDSFMSGIIAGCIVQGAQAAGLTCYVTSLTAYAQETGADGAYLWLTEQTLRETYLSPFERAVKMGAAGILASCSNTGAVWNGGNSALLTGIVRDEWGFSGTIVSCKKESQSTLSAEQMLLAGGDLLMQDWDWRDSADFTYLDINEYLDNPILLSLLQTAAKHALYSGLNTSYTNSIYNATHEDDSIVVITEPPSSWWIWIIAAINAVAAGACLFWIYVARHKKDRGDGYPVEELPPWLQAPPKDAGLSAEQHAAAEAQGSATADTGKPLQDTGTDIRSSK